MELLGDADFLGVTSMGAVVAVEIFGDWLKLELRAEAGAVEGRCGKSRRVGCMHAVDDESSFSTSQRFSEIICREEPESKINSKSCSSTELQKCCRPKG